VVDITAVDGSAPMLALAQDAVRSAALDARIILIQGYLPGLPLEDHVYDAILSKDLLHHLPDPLMLWKEIARLGKRGAAVYVMDLVRPLAPSDARRIVDTVAASDDPILREDFYRSLCAAFTPAEVQEQLIASGLDLRVQRLSDRHMLVSGLLR
jgi:ubiquinone/menaquinone biosynthesis C-methylase UbiE